MFLFTPKGDVISMPKGATPLDFAYRIHSAVGNKCVGSKINGRIMPLDTPLETGDRVEIITSASSKGPSAELGAHLQNPAGAGENPRVPEKGVPRGKH